MEELLKDYNLEIYTAPRVPIYLMPKVQHRAERLPEQTFPRLTRCEATLKRCMNNVQIQCKNTHSTCYLIKRIIATNVHYAASSGQLELNLQVRIRLNELRSMEFFGVMATQSSSSSTATAKATAPTLESISSAAV
ncbi:unnamed protein product [Gongylonema pulchrum]|uniref:PAZ domain-containing protein n=1 Tax=Gongylonema pulchrum TaxID=637853 RepID=A0A183DX94_9BILA|nr:unnamed protein product [Gongylonema pulchrum]